MKLVNSVDSAVPGTIQANPGLLLTIKGHTF